MKQSPSKNYTLHIFFAPLILIVLFAINVGFKRYSSEVHLKRAYEAREQSNWQTVIDEITLSENKYFTIDPMCTPLAWYSGSAYYNMGNQPKAFDDFSRSYTLNPNHVHVLNNLGTAYEIKGDHQQAIAKYERALQISPNFTEARLNLVAAYFNSGNKTAAYLAFRKITADTANEKYMQILPLVLKPQIKILSDSITFSPLEMQLEAIYNTPEWAKNVYFKSIAENKSFKAQLLLDALFVLDANEKKSNFVYLNNLLIHYNIKI
jgi:tetratricopeptide (TPR) repeat protein